MNELDKVRLSALVDGEVSPLEMEQMLDLTRNDQSLRKVWGRFNRISASLHGDNGSDVADKIWAKLQQEPTIMVPGNKNRFSGAIRRFGVGLAIAATVAGVAVGGLRFLSPGISTSPQLLATAPDQVEYVRAKGTRWQIDDPVLENELNVYLVEHGGYAGSTSMNGMQSYVKVVGYDDEK